MRRSLLVPALAALLGASLLAGNAGACCHKKAACAPAPCPAPAPVVECAPAPVACAPAPKHGCFKSKFKMPKFKGLCHKKAACAPAPCAVAVPAQAPCYGAPMPSAQVVPSGQA